MHCEIFSKLCLLLVPLTSAVFFRPPYLISISCLAVAYCAPPYNHLASASIPLSLSTSQGHLPILSLPSKLLLPLQPT